MIKDLWSYKREIDKILFYFEIFLTFSTVKAIWIVTSFNIGAMLLLMHSTQFFSNQVYLKVCFEV